MSSSNQTFALGVGNSFYQQHIVGLLLSAIILAVIYPKTGLDQFLIAPYFDAATQSFPLKHQVFLEMVMHSGLKYCIVFVAVSTLALGLAGNKIAPFRASIGLYKKQFIWVFIGMALSSSAVSILKGFSIHGCPNNLTIYGGNLPLLKLFENLPKGVEAGHCFPGGHASGGFAFMAFYFAFRDYKPKLAVAMLVTSLVLGFIMGWAQMMRGAHFLSHNLWTAWVVWMMLFVQYLIWPPKTLLSSTLRQP
ncbi:phosphatase PAP2 family protein [Methylotenera sp.]|uniref:phosphatase PAP2 family protein n=1 Tax=Methylotenera sp. TaxID=2051956 RepID=UPI002734BE4E|nr:phosphatase PAP2 family protein [Methylotenera sp.]MDP3308877.1 phosphatase PAP2 family protein [Methylotenera sp.]